MNILKEVKKSPKLTISFIVTVILNIYDLVSVNAELLGIPSKTMAQISLLVAVISMVWKYFKPEESAFKMLAKHVGTRPKDPPPGSGGGDNDGNTDPINHGG